MKVTLKKIGAVIGVIVLFIFAYMPTSLLGVLAGMALVVLLYRFMTRRREKAYAELSGGFEHYLGIFMPEKDLLRIVVLEELEKNREAGLFLRAEKTRRIRLLLTVGYLLLHCLFLNVMYYRAEAVGVLTTITLVYVFFFCRCDAVKEVCKAVKKQPDREIEQVVRDLCDGKRRKSRVPVGAAVFALTLALFCAAHWEGKFTVANYEGNLCITEYEPGIFFDGDLEIPDSHNGKLITGIGRNAFKDLYALQHVQIPESVILIDSFAFKNCSQLKEIQLPAGLKKLGGESFKNCKALKRVVIPKGVEEIRGSTFENCSALEQVVLHDGIVSIHAFAFQGCSRLKQITLPSQIKEIKESTFSACSSLQEIVIPHGVYKIGAHAFDSCKALSKVDVPATVTEIRSSAFRNCDNLTEIEIPHDTQVDKNAFKDSPTKVNRRNKTGMAPIRPVMK